MKHRPVGQRSRTEWGVRLGLAAACVLLGCGAVSHALALSLVRSNPDVAHALAPFDGRITARFSEVLSHPDTVRENMARADTIARQALRSDPMAVQAAATLGTISLLRNEPARADRLFSYSMQLSRRDVRTQFWAIEHAVAQGDVHGALSHYDIALSTKRETAELLFSVLVSAIDDQAIRTELVRTLTRKPIWGQNFLDYAAVYGKPTLAVELFADARRNRVPVSQKASASLIERLIDSGETDAAWQYYTAIRAGADRLQSRDPDFTVQAEVPTRFDWVALEPLGATAAIQRIDQQGLFDFSTSPTFAGAVLQQFQLLPTGTYVLTGRSTGIDQPRGARPYWTLTCRGGRELGRMEMPNSTQAGGAFEARFAVPSGCAVQILSLAIPPSSDAGGARGQIDRASLRPVR